MLLDHGTLGDASCGMGVAKIQAFGRGLMIVRSITNNSSPGTTIMILRIKTKTGRLVLNNLTESTTLGHLQKVLAEKTSVPSSLQKILHGYPPKEVPFSNPHTTLLSLHIKTGETLILETRTSPVTPELCSGDVIDLTSSSNATMSESGPRLARKVVPADNSCLFKSISLLLCSGKESSKELRELVGGLVLSDPVKYNTAMLGRDGAEYVKWLLKEESWGGAIEVSVFSEYFKTEIDVVDIQTQRIDKFGEDKGYHNRALLLYDGIHYDPLLIHGPQGNIVQTQFPTSDGAVLAEAVAIAKAAFEARQFTDLAGFTLRCLVCGKALTGQTDAQSHAKATGHMNFGEV